MPAETGLTAQLTLGEEELYGVRAGDLTRGLAFLSESLRAPQDRDLDAGVGFGDYSARQALVARRRRDGAGHLTFELVPRGVGLLFKHMLGADPGSSPLITALGGEPAAYLHVYTPGCLTGPGHSLSIQKGVEPEPGAPLEPVELLGCKVAAWQIDFGLGGPLTASLHMDARVLEDRLSYSGETPPELVVPSYPVPFDSPETPDIDESTSSLTPFTLPIDLTDTRGYAALLIGGRELARAVAGRISGHNALLQPPPFDVDGLKSEPQPSDPPTLFGQLALDFVGRAELDEAFFGGEPVSLVVRSTGRMISEGVQESIEIRLPDVRFPAETPVAVVPGAVLTCPFLVLRPSDGGSAEPGIVIEYTTVDPAC